MAQVISWRAPEQELPARVLPPPRQPEPPHEPLPEPPPEPASVGSGTLAREQLVVTGGQLATGIGNLAFALVMARTLTRPAFTDLAAFLVCYLLLHLPGAAFGAGTALTPALARRTRRRATAIGLVGAAVVAASAPLIASALHQPVAFPLLLAGAVPTAALLALERGRLYGTARHARVARSLLAEPVVRLTVGLALAQELGAPGAAAGVVLAGYAGLLVATWTRKRGGELNHAPVRPHAAVTAFLFLAVLQNQDLLLATHLLPAGEAAKFAAISTLGGVAAFATATIPLVLLPRAAGYRHALGVAVGVAATIGGGAVLALAVAAPLIVETVFGARYASIAPLAAPYVLAMALLGVVRVLIADRAARPRPATSLMLVAAAVMAHVALVLRLGTTARGVVTATLSAMAALTIGFTGVTALRLLAVRRRTERVRAAVMAVVHPSRTVLVIGGLTLAALALRLAVTRGLWVDEAISVSQARLPFDVMLERLQSDVHPPLHAALLWVTVRLLGDGELAVRLPSMLAGTLTVPLLYLTGRELFDRRTGTIAAALGAVLPLGIWYSQEARMYSLYMLFATAAVLGQARAIRKGGFWAWTLYAVATAALLWTQYLGALQVVAQQVVFVVALQRRRREGRRVGRFVFAWLGALLFAGALVVPLLPILESQYAVYTQHGAGLSGLQTQAGTAVSSQPGLTVYSVIANLIWAVGGYHANRTMEQVGALWPFGMMFALLLLGRRRSVGSTALLVVVALPIAGLFLIGLKRQDLFELRYIAGIVPALALLGARAITTLARSRLVIGVVVGVLVVALLGSLADQQLNGTNPRLYDFRGAVQEIAAQAKPGDVVLYTPQYINEVVEYYGPELRRRPAGKWREATRGAGRVFVIGSFLDKANLAGRTGQVLSNLEQKRKLVDEFRRPQIRVWVFD